MNILAIIQHYLALAWAWLVAHPTFGVPLIGGLVVWATKKRSPEAYAKMAARWPQPLWSRIAAFTQLLAAVFPDPLKARAAAIKFIFGIVEPVEDHKPAKEKSPPGSGSRSIGTPVLVLFTVGVALPNEGCKEALVVMDVYEALQPKIRCGIENQDLPRAEMLRRCAIAASEEPLVDDAVAASRVAGAQHSVAAANVARHDAEVKCSTGK